MHQENSDAERQNQHSLKSDNSSFCSQLLYEKEISTTIEMRRAETGYKQAKVSEEPL
jgi:hypothetical protein